jgi:hypothetical protein
MRMIEGIEMKNIEGTYRKSKSRVLVTLLLNELLHDPSSEDPTNSIQLSLIFSGFLGDHVKLKMTVGIQNRGAIFVYLLAPKGVLKLYIVLYPLIIFKTILSDSLNLEVIRQHLDLRGTRPPIGVAISSSLVAIPATISSLEATRSISATSSAVKTSRTLVIARPRSVSRIMAIVVPSSRGFVPSSVGIRHRFSHLYHSLDDH